MRIVGLLLALAGCDPHESHDPISPQTGLEKTRDDPARIWLRRSDRSVLALPGGEHRTIASLLRVAGPIRYGGFRWNESGIPPGPTWIRIDLTSQTLSVFRGGHEIGTGVVLYGADSHPTPRGRFPILAKLKDHRSSLYDAEMPYTLRLTSDGVAIHGSNVRRGAATHGCIGIPERFAAHIFQSVQRGDPVFIVSSADRDSA